MSELVMQGVRCPNGCRGRDGLPFVIAQVDARAEALDAYCGKCRQVIRWRRRVKVAV